MVTPAFDEALTIRVMLRPIRPNPLMPSVTFTKTPQTRPWAISDMVLTRCYISDTKSVQVARQRAAAAGEFTRTVTTARTGPVRKRHRPLRHGRSLGLPATVCHTEPPRSGTVRIRSPAAVNVIGAHARRGPYVVAAPRRREWHSPRFLRTAKADLSDIALDSAHPRGAPAGSPVNGPATALLRSLVG